MSIPQIRLAIGLPAYGGRVVAEQSRMWLELGHTLAASEERFTLGVQLFVDVCGIERARNLLLAQAMIKDCDWLFMLDADTWIVHDHEDNSPGFQILRMISEADRAGAVLVGAPVVRRVASRDRVDVNVWADAKEPLRVELVPPTGSAARSLTPTYAIGAACIAVNLRKIGESTFKFTDQLSEDLEFCRQLRALDAKILCDWRVRTAHLSRTYPLLSP